MAELEAAEAAVEAREQEASAHEVDEDPESFIGVEFGSLDLLPETQQAIQAMNQVVINYPDSEYADDARKKIQIAQDQIAGKEMQVGRYYQERREFLASINRFRVVIENYQSTRHVEEALHRLTECYLALGIVQEAQTSAAVLGHNFPDSSWYQDSYKLLNKGGVEPQENRGSWISRAFRG